MLSLSMPIQFLPTNGSSRMTLFSITDELEKLNFVEISLLRSPLSDEVDFETTLASSLVVASR